MSKLKALLLTCIFILVSFPAQAKIIHVPGDSSTIQKGIDGAVNGDTVLVVEGHYYEQINFQGKGILVTSEFITDGDSSHIENTIIDGDSSGSVVLFLNQEDSTSIIQGFTIQNGLAIYGGGIHCDHSSPTISHCTIINNIADGGGGIYCFQSSPKVDSCTIFGNTAKGNDLTKVNHIILGSTASLESLGAGCGGGILCVDSSNAIISNCRIRSNYSGYGGGISCHASYTNINKCLISENNALVNGGGISCWDSSLMTIDQCTITRNSSGWRGGGISCFNCDYRTEITNTILWADTKGDEIWAYSGVPPTLYVTYCDIDGWWPGVGNLDCCPLFCDPGSSNYYLAENSCCVGAGEGGIDIGAFGIGCPAYYICGDINFDCHVSVSDVVYLIGYLFKNAPPPLCPPAPYLGCGDPDSDGRVAVGDIIYLINFLFKGGPSPVC